MSGAYVGVSGWRYRSWRGDFYPPGLPQRQELSYIAANMTSVELNGSFYSLQRPTTYQAIADDTPPGFPVAVKGSRYITHLKRLNDIDTALANFLGSGLLALGDKLGPLLWQLPPNLAYDEGLLVSFFDRLPRTTAELAALARQHDDKLKPGRAFLEPLVQGPVRHALEVRHPSFVTEEAVELIRKHDVSLVVSDSPGTWPLIDETTSDFRYVRLHGHTQLYYSGYSARSLDEWARKAKTWLADGMDVYVYFDNDARGRAPYDAVGLLERLSVTD